MKREFGIAVQVDVELFDLRVDRVDLRRAGIGSRVAGLRRCGGREKQNGAEVPENPGGRTNRGCSRQYQEEVSETELAGVCSSLPFWAFQFPFNSVLFVILCKFCFSME